MTLAEKKREMAQQLEELARNMTDKMGAARHARRREGGY
jgi:hypothetical protein